MTKQNGYQNSILISLSRYQQLLQFQNLGAADREKLLTHPVPMKQNAARGMTEKPKCTSLQKSEASSNRSDATSRAAASQYQSEEGSHEKSKVNSSAAEESDSQETICRKILHTITQSFEKKNQREK